jgi:hypothetical protein
MIARALLVLLIATIAQPAFGAATIVIVNGDDPGEGLNDPTPTTPIGFNPGLTLGVQRRNVFTLAALRWGQALTSAVEIRVLVKMDPLTCTATAVVAGNGQATSMTANFPEAPVRNAWYPRALADKIRGFDANPGQPDITATFNSSLGSSGIPGAPGCGFDFYLGLDNNAPAGQMDFYKVVYHEFAHGLGVGTSTFPDIGVFNSGLPHISDFFLLDTTTGKTWNTMTEAEIIASAVNTRKLVWTGANANGAAQLHLQPGVPEVVVSSPSNVAGTYIAAPAAGGGGLLSSPGVTGDLMPAIDSGGVSTTDACEPIVGANVVAISGKIALADRGTCAFATKAQNVQNAGAIGLILVNDNAASPPTTPGGVPASITIPVVHITQADGNALKAQLRFRSRTRSGITTTLRINTAQRAGLDPLGRLLMYTPSPLQLGVSVVHFDPIASPNLLMEPPPPAPDVPDVAFPPPGLVIDVTFNLLKDIGW